MLFYSSVTSHFTVYNDMNTKTCLRCKDEKPEEEFHKSPKYPGGLTSWCKVCIQQNQDYKNSKLLKTEPSTVAQRQAKARAKRAETAKNLATLLQKLCPECQTKITGQLKKLAPAVNQ